MQVVPSGKTISSTIRVNDTTSMKLAVADADLRAFGLFQPWGMPDGRLASIPVAFATL